MAQDILDTVHTASQVNELGLFDLHDRLENKDYCIPMYMRSIDDVYVPCPPQAVEIWNARPGHGKTSTLIARATKRALYLKEHHPKRVAVLITLEQPVEQVWRYGIANNSNVPLDKLSRGDMDSGDFESIKDVVLDNSVFPLWVIGRSRKNSHLNLTFTVAHMVEAIHALEEKWDVKVDCVFGDYLQKIHAGRPRNNRVLEIEDTMYALEAAAQRTNCAWIWGSQAKQEVEKNNPPIPGPSDGKWAAVIEEAAAVIWSVVRPIKYVKLGEYFAGMQIKNENMAVYQLSKHRWCKAENNRFWFNFNPAYNRLEDFDSEYVPVEAPHVEKQLKPTTRTPMLIDQIP